MRFVKHLTLPVDSIDVGERLRQVDPDHAEVLAGMIGEVGLQHPIEVYNPWQPNSLKRSPRYRLIIGAHRLAAFKLLGWEEIDARLMEPEGKDVDLEARYREEIENLGRHDLNALDRAAALAAFKRDYQALHPETKTGQFGGRGGKRNESAIFALSKIAAQRTGLSERTVHYAVAFFEALSPAVRDRLAGTYLAKEQSQLVALSKLDHERQVQVVDILLDDANEVTRVNEASGLIDDPKPAKVDATDKMFKRLLSLYESAPKKVQTRFDKYLAEKNRKPAKRTNGSSKQIDLEDLTNPQGASA